MELHVRFWMKKAIRVKLWMLGALLALTMCVGAFFLYREKPIPARVDNTKTSSSPSAAQSPGQTVGVSGTWNIHVRFLAKDGKKVHLEGIFELEQTGQKISGRQKFKNVGQWFPIEGIRTGNQIRLITPNVDSPKFVGTVRDTPSGPNVITGELIMHDGKTPPQERANGSWDAEKI
jgi:hypothetical protein